MSELEGGRGRERLFWRLCGSILPVALSVWLVLYLLKYVRVDEILYHLRHVDAAMLGLGAIIYALIILLRSIRVQFLIEYRLSLGRVIPILLTYNLVNFLVPFRIGEFSYVVLMKQSRKVSTGVALTSLTYLKELDFLFLLIIFYLGKTFYAELLDFSGGTLVEAACVLLVSGVLFTVFMNRKIKQFLLAWFRSDRVIVKFLNRILDAFSTYRTWKSLSVSFSITALIWICMFIFYYFLGLSIGFPLSLWEFSVVFILLTVANLLPVQGLAGFGTFEGAIVLGLTRFGVTVSEAVALGFAMHLLYIGYFLVCGIAGAAILYSRKGDSTPE